MSRELVQVWKTPDGRYFENKEDAQIIMCVEEVKAKIRQAAPQLLGFTELMCQYSAEITSILIAYQNDIRALSVQSQPIPEIAHDDGSRDGIE